MSIVCGTDFSDAAEHAVRVAATFARALAEPLVLVHVVDEAALGLAPDGLAMQCADAAARGLADVAERCVDADVAITTRVEIGAPDLRLDEIAREQAASLLVLGLVGRTARTRVGSHATRLAHAAPVPVLLVGDAAPFLACASGERPLRVLLSVDLSSTSDATVAWIERLVRVGPCEVVLQHLYDPRAERRRLGLHGAPWTRSRDTEVEALLERELRERFCEALASGRAVLRLSPVLSWFAEDLIEIAETERFDVTVVGGRRRSGLASVRHDSVSDRVLRIAPTAVLRIPVESAAQRPVEVARLGRVLVATDLSPLSDRAIEYAYALVAPSGVVHLLHVIEDAGPPNPLYAHYEPGHAPTQEEKLAREREAEAALQARVPAEAERRGVRTRIEVLHAATAAEAIRSSAERLTVDAVCLATHGRSGLSRVLAGSVASGVASTCTRPVVLIRPATDD